MNNKYYDSYYTDNNNRNEKEIVKNKFEDNENDYISLSDFVFPNHYIGRKNNDEMLK